MTYTEGGKNYNKIPSGDDTTSSGPDYACVRGSRSRPPGGHAISIRWSARSRRYNVNRGNLTSGHLAAPTGLAVEAVERHTHPQARRLDRVAAGVVADTPPREASFGDTLGGLTSCRPLCRRTRGTRRGTDLLGWDLEGGRNEGVETCDMSGRACDSRAQRRFGWEAAASGVWDGSRRNLERSVQVPAAGQLGEEAVEEYTAARDVVTAGGRTENLGEVEATRVPRPCSTAAPQTGRAARPTEGEQNNG